MSETTTTKPTKIEFIQYHQPALKDGDYEISVQQELVIKVNFKITEKSLKKLKAENVVSADVLKKLEGIKDQDFQGEENFLAILKDTIKGDLTEENQPLILKYAIENIENFEIFRTFSVAGERFDLKPKDIHAVFPPAGSLGEHSNVLPHIILNRSTLPWERLPLADKFRITEQSLKNLKAKEDVLTKLKEIKDQDIWGKETFLAILKHTIGDDLTDDNKTLILKSAIVNMPLNIPWLALLLFEEGEKLGGMIEKKEFIKQYTKDTPSGDRVWEHLLQIGWLKSINSTETKARILTVSNSKLEGDFDGLESQVNSILDQSRSPKVITVRELQNPANDGVKFPQLALESGQHKNDKVTIIDIEKSLLDTILPTKEDLEYLAHVRQGTDGKKLVGDELAVIIGNRLPKKGSISTVHLVSVEGRYNDKSFNFQQPENNEYIRLVSLKSWRFACVDEKQSFKGLLTHINREPSTLRLPKVDNAEAEGYLSMGYLPLPHFLRQGGKTFSWYHSPLITGNNPTDNITLPIRAADELVRYNPHNGMFDISYAAAWELGRLLALQSKSFSISLYHWKRSHKQALKCIEAAIDSHLPFHDLPNIELPDAIASWFTNLSLLKGIPFNYLVPDEQMLPVESIRFFWVDPLWVECLLDGAFSIGRVTTSDHAHDSSHPESPAANPHEQVTGFLLRSDVVAGWPGLLVDGYDKAVNNENAIPDNDKLPLLRMDRLSANVLICLFKGEVKTVDIHQKPETIHFGLDLDDEEKTFYKELKNKEGQEIKAKVDQIPWKDQNTRTINIDQFKQDIERELQNNTITFPSFTSAQFALEMIEGVEKVRFTIDQ